MYLKCNAKHMSVKMFLWTPQKQTDQASKETLELPDLVNRHIKRPSKKADDVGLFCGWWN